MIIHDIESIEYSGDHIMIDVNRHESNPDDVNDLTTIFVHKTCNITIMPDIVPNTGQGYIVALIEP